MGMMPPTIIPVTEAHAAPPRPSLRIPTKSQSRNNSIYRSYVSFSLSKESTYFLQDNYVYGDGEWKSYGGDWNNDWEYFNCYAYAIGRYESYTYYDTVVKYQPGDFSNSGEFNCELSIESLSALVVSDLQTLGCQNVSVYDSFDPSDLDINEKLICVRKNSIDYHFMKYDRTTSKWYHKPGQTAILQYKYYPENDRI